MDHYHYAGMEHIDCTLNAVAWIHRAAQRAEQPWDCSKQWHQTPRHWRKHQAYWKWSDTAIYPQWAGQRTSHSRKSATQTWVWSSFTMRKSEQIQLKKKNDTKTNIEHRNERKCEKKEKSLWWEVTAQMHTVHTHRLVTLYMIYILRLLLNA